VHLETERVQLSATSGSFTARFISRLSSTICSFDIFAGAMKPNQPPFS
jgi:hypothetical protein